MEILTIISIVVTIIVGVIAILEKFFHILPRNRGARKIFEHEFNQWKDSGYTYIPTHEIVRRFGGHAISNELNYEKGAFALLCAIQHGDEMMHNLIEQYRDTDDIIFHLISFINGRGVRVGWRAEYALSKLPIDKVKYQFDQLSQHSGDYLKESRDRILNDKIIEYLQKQESGKDPKLRSYAREVLNQIRTRPVRIK
jgi:hypothetical protein